MALGRKSQEELNIYPMDCPVRLVQVGIAGTSAGTADSAAVEASQGQKGSVGLHLGLGLLLGQAQGLPAQDPQDQDRLEAAATAITPAREMEVAR